MMTQIEKILKRTAKIMKQDEDQTREMIQEWREQNGKTGRFTQIDAEIQELKENATKQPKGQILEKKLTCLKKINLLGMS